MVILEQAKTARLTTVCRHTVKGSLKRRG